MNVVEVRRTLTLSEAKLLWRDSSAPDLAPLEFPRPTTFVDADTREPLAIVARLDPDRHSGLRRALLDYPCDTNQVRTAGIRTRSRSFGFLARSAVLQRNVCCACEGSKLYPDAHQRVADTAGHLSELLRAAYPEQYARNLALVDDVLPEWLMPGGLWTSGVVNFNSAIPYHFDRNNFDGAWSAMPTIRRHVRGGHLHLPELLTVDGDPVVLPCADGDVALLYAQGLLHGVTPWRKIRPDGYRISAVYYAVRRMQNCLPWVDEVARSATARTSIEDHQLERQTAAGYIAAAEPLEPDHAALADLAEFARLEVDAGDIEPWAAMLAELHRAGHLDLEGAHWAVALYNTYDAFASAFGAFDRWPSPRAWAEAPDRADAAEFECTQERRNLRGGRVLRRLASHVAALGVLSQDDWVRVPLLGDPSKDFARLTDHLRVVWGVGRQSAFEWAEFEAKVVGLEVDCDDAQLWESEGPRRSLQRLYGNPSPSAGWLDERAHECKAYLEEQGVALSWVDFETVICDFNVMRGGRYYPGRHLAALTEEVDTAPESWRAPLRAAWAAVIPERWQAIAPGIDPLKKPVYRDTGRILTEP